MKVSDVRVIGPIGPFRLMWLEFHRRGPLWS